MDPLVVKFIEVVLMQVLVFGAVAAILIAAIWDVVQAKVQESRRRDQIAPKPVTHNGFARHRTHSPFVHHLRS
jgi:Na+-translocating ferredoxin:NAD+ oxidoreductase RnfG subunit